VAVTTAATTRAAAATTKMNKKEERIKRARMLITGGIGAAAEDARLRKTLWLYRPKKEMLGKP